MNSDEFHIFWHSSVIINFHLKGNITITNQLGIFKLGDYATTHNTRARWTVKVTKKMFNNNLRVFLEVSDIIPPRVLTIQTGSNYESVDRKSVV